MSNFVDLSKSEDFLEYYGIIKKGHFILSSKWHSDTYIDKPVIYNQPRLLQTVSNRLAGLIMKHYDDLDIDCVVSPAIGGMILGFSVAYDIGANFAWTERPTPDSCMVSKRFRIPEGSRVLIVDDVITTGGSINETINALKPSKVKVVGVACMVNRMLADPVWNFPTTSLVNMKIPLYAPDNLPPELAAIPVVKPGSKGV